jgi:hypothetical protein
MERSGSTVIRPEMPFVLASLRNRPILSSNALRRERWSSMSLCGMSVSTAADQL